MLYIYAVAVVYIYTIIMYLLEVFKYIIHIVHFQRSSIEQHRLSSNIFAPNKKKVLTIEFY